MNYSVLACHTNPDAEYVVLSSGLGGHASFWKPQLDALSQHFHVLSYDHEGCHADSSLLPVEYSFENLAVQLMHILQLEKIQNFHFIGHAIGGFIGAELAILCSNQQLNLKSLSCINAWDRLDPHTQKCFEARIHLLKNTGADAYVRAQALFLYPPAWISKHHHFLTQVEDIQLIDFPPTDNVLTRIAAARQFAMNQTHRVALENTALHFIANVDDFLVPVQKSKDLQDYFKRGKLTTLPSGGHASTVTQTELLNATILNFLLEYHTEV